MAAGDLGDIAEYVFKEKPEYAARVTLATALNLGATSRRGDTGAPQKGEKGTAREWLCRENVKPQKAVLDFYGHGRALECP